MDPMSNEFKWISEAQKDRFAEIYHAVLELDRFAVFVDISDHDRNEVLTFRLSNNKMLKVGAYDCRVDGAMLEFKVY